MTEDEEFEALEQRLNYKHKEQSMNKDEIAQMMQDSAGNSWGTEAHFQRFAALVAAAKEAEFMDRMTIAYMDGYEKGKDAGAIAERERSKQ